MTYITSRQLLSGPKKNDRSFYQSPWTTPVATRKAEQHLLDGLPDTAALDGLDRPWWQMLVEAIGTMAAEWTARGRSRRALAQVDARTLRDAGIDPGSVAFEMSQPFWRRPLTLRDMHAAD